MSLPFIKKTFTPGYILNTAPCQFSEHVGKTKKTLQFIKHAAILSRVRDGANETGIHHITLIATNNNLEETKQWRIRTRKDTLLGRLNILVLSSKKGDYNNISVITQMMLNARKADQLPDIIIFCTHAKRTQEIVKFTDTLNNGNFDFTKIGIHQVTTSIMFDEADNNKEIIVDFLKNTNDIINKKGDYSQNTTIRDIHFITATPYKTFWSSLESVGIKNMKNMSSILKNNYDKDEYPEIHMSHQQLTETYRKISDHCIRYDITDNSKKPHEYANDVLNKIMEEIASGVRSNTTPLTIFAPAERECISHKKMKSVFAPCGFHVIIHNGEDKGFYSPDGRMQTFDEFNTIHSVSGEFKDTLVKWRELNPHANLLITGYLNIQRGVTFNTIGFNFTDMIVSYWHLTNIGSLIQILGRANGGKNYVKIMNIWSSKQVIEKAFENIESMNSILIQEPEEFDESDFRKKTPAEIMDPAMRVPVVVNLSREEYDSIKKSGTSWDTSIIFNLIDKYNPSLCIEIKKLKKDQITEPETDNAIRKFISNTIANVEENKKFLIAIKKAHKEKDVYQIFMDKKNHRLIVCRFYGSLLKTDTTETDVS